MTQLADPISEQFDRMPPHNIEAEQCCVASMMLAVARDEFERIRRCVEREAFYQTDHKIIYEVLCAVWDQNRACDAVVVREELLKRQLLEEVGGAAYLAQLLDTVPSAAHGAEYAAIVTEKYQLRQCISEANEIIRRAYARSKLAEPSTEIITDAVKFFSSLSVHGLSNKITKLKDAVSAVLSRIEEGRINRIKTDIEDLDRAVFGLPIGKFTIVGGRPGMGKSLLVKKMLRNIAARGESVGIVTLEENEEKIAENTLSAMSGVHNNKISYGTMCKEEWEAAVSTLPKIERMNFFIADGPVKLSEVETAITTLAVEHKCKVIGLDYIQLVDGNDPNENREITLVSRSVKAAFKRLDVAGIAVAQLNRQAAQGEGRRPTKKDLRGSGSLEQDGDLIVLLHSEDYYRRERGDNRRDHKLELIVAKNKDGPEVDVPVHLDMRTQEISKWIQPHLVPEFV